MATSGQQNPLFSRIVVGVCVGIAVGAAGWAYLSRLPVAVTPRAGAPIQALNGDARPAAVVTAAPLPVPSIVSQPAPPAAVTPAPPPSQGPTFDVVRVSPQGNAVIAGRGAPGAEITVFDGSTEVARTRVDQRGEFVALPAMPLEPGGRELTLASRSGAGPDVKGQEQVVLAIPERAVARPAAGVVTPSAESSASLGQLAPVVAMLLPQQGAPRVLQATPAPPLAGAVTLDTVDYDDAGAIQFKGGVAGSPAGSTIRVYVDNQPIGDGQADPAGRWTLKPSGRVTTGVHVVRADRLGADGAVVARVEMPFQRSEIAPVEVAAGRVVVQPGQNLWRLARAAYGRGTQYTVIYLANRDQIRDAQRIYPGQAFSIPER